VSEVVVLLQTENPGDERLVAYIAGEVDRLPTNRMLREALNAKLPSYMVPAQFAHLESMPRTGNGKIDVNGLKTLPITIVVEHSDFVAPRSAAEETLASIAAEVLQLPRVGVEDNLFELGADSLRIFQIAARAARAEIPMTAQHLLRGRTLAAALLSASKDAGNGSISASKLRHITRAPREVYRLRGTNPLLAKH
jgi:aryl carrier-like protein